MKERVELHNNGLSIESPTLFYRNNKWKRRYIACKKPVDLSHAILYVYRNKRSKQNNIFVLSLVLDNYLGFESGFELKKQSNTLSVLTGNEVVTFAFLLSESLVIWDTWLNNICGHSTSFYMQMKRVPHIYNQLQFKEVRCFIHGSRLALLHGKPLQQIFHVNVSDHALEVNDKNLLSVTPDLQKPNIEFVLLCPRAEAFRKCIDIARREGVLQRTLSNRLYESDWHTTMKKKSVGDLASQMTVNLSELAYLRSTPEPELKYRITPVLPLEQLSYQPYSYSHYSLHIDQENCPHDPHDSGIIPQSVVYGNDELNTNNYVNLSRNNSVDERRMHSVRSPQVSPGLDEPHYCNISHLNNQNIQTAHNELSNLAERCKSLPEYVNVGITSTVQSQSERPTIRATSSVLDRIRRRSDNSVTHPSINASKGRSIPDIMSTSVSENRFENWKKAKKFFSAFKQASSHSDLNQRKKNESHLAKASSTGALQFAFEYGDKRSLDSFSDTDDPPPQLNKAISDHMRESPPTPDPDEPPPDGLVRLKDEMLPKARNGVSGILARRLASSVRGSFSKYDGERITHMYQPTAKTSNEERPPRPPKPEKYDGIASAVNRGQEKLKMSDRRASNVSFNRINIVSIDPDVDLRSDKAMSAAEVNASRKSLLHRMTPRHSNSHSEYTRSSTESLSSGARSRISFRKRHTSPPRIQAPSLPATMHPTLSQPSSSIDSLNSEQTARSSSPIPLPARNIKTPVASSATDLNYCDIALQRNPSSSSSNSLGSRIEYIVIDPLSTTAAKRAHSEHQLALDHQSNFSPTSGAGLVRRRSQGQGSSASDTLSVGQPSRSGFFKKYRRTRRDQRLSNSQSQPNF